MAEIGLDAFDLRLLRLLQDDARLSHVALSERVHLSPSQCARCLQRLEQAGVVEGYAVRLDDRLMGLGVTALVNVTLERHGESPATTLHATLEALPEVVECLLITGDADYQLRVIVPDLESFPPSSSRSSCAYRASPASARASCWRRSSRSAACRCRMARKPLRWTAAGGALRIPHLRAHPW